MAVRYLEHPSCEIDGIRKDVYTSIMQTYPSSLLYRLVVSEKKETEPDLDGGSSIEAIH